MFYDCLERKILDLRINIHRFIRGTKKFTHTRNDCCGGEAFAYCDAEIYSSLWYSSDLVVLTKTIHGVFQYILLYSYVEICTGEIFFLVTFVYSLSYFVIIISMFSRHWQSLFKNYVTHRTWTVYCRENLSEPVRIKSEHGPLQVFRL